MNRDKAIEIAAETMGLHDFDDQKWASAVVGRADALLAAMDEADAVEYCDETCCAATEARVVREIAAWVRERARTQTDSMTYTALLIERGNWRAKEPVR